MRSTTKLKELLHRYYCEFSLTEEQEFRMFMTDLSNVDQEVHSFTGANFSSVVSKGHSFYLKQKRKEDHAR